MSTKPTARPIDERPPGAWPEDTLATWLIESEVYTDIEVEDMTWGQMVAAAEYLISPPLFVPDPETRSYTLDGHSGHGPSASERWMTCTASVSASRAHLERLDPLEIEGVATSTIAAKQGTTAHTAGEAELRYMLGEIEASERDSILLDLAVAPPDGEEYDSDMEDFLAEYVEFVRSYVDEGRTVLVESRVEAVVPLKSTHAKILGTDIGTIPGSGDMIVLPDDEHKTLVVGDLKYGRGIEVEVQDNPQIRIYALGALSMLADEEGNLPEIDMVEYAIIQPRLGGIKISREPVAALLAWRDQHLAPALGQTLCGPEGGATFNPTEDACQWCPVKGNCAALAEQRIAAGVELFQIITEAEAEGTDVQVETLETERLGELLTQIRGLTDLHDSIKAEAHRRLCRGEDVPGFKLVSYTPARKWKPGAEERLAKARALWKEPTLMSPTQAEKVLKAKGKDVSKIESLIDAPDKRPILADEKSNRKPWAGRDPEEMFPDE